MNINDEIWRLVPPEEKFQMLAKSHAKGTMAVFGTIIISSAIAIGLKLNWLLWCSLLFSPLIFQFIAGKTWRDIRPRAVLEFLAARSVVRRYAYSLKAKNLGVQLMFRGYMRMELPDQKVNDAFIALEEASTKTLLWISLLDSAVIVISEGRGGAHLDFGHLIDETLIIEGRSDDGKEYSNFREVVLSSQLPKFKGRKYVISSIYPVALNAFERKLQDLRKEEIYRKEQDLKFQDAKPVEEGFDQVPSGY